MTGDEPIDDSQAPGDRIEQKESDEQVQAAGGASFETVGDIDQDGIERIGFFGDRNHLQSDLNGFVKPGEYVMSPSS